MERSAIVKTVVAAGAASALVALGALLPKPPASGSASLANADSVAAPNLASSADGDVGQASAAPSGPVHVYVCGAVRKPGVYTMPAGARVVDAIEQGGGASGSADLEQLNLAEPLSDAMKVDVPIKGRQLAASVDPMQRTRSQRVARGANSARRHTGRGGSQKLSTGQTIDINTASESDLLGLPGVGPSLARRIVEYRAANGPFQLPDDLQNVSGIGASKFAKMEPFLRI